MDIDLLKGKWDQLKNKTQHQWKMLNDDDIVAINGDAHILSKRLQEIYGIEDDEADKQIEEWFYRYS